MTSNPQVGAGSSHGKVIDPFTRTCFHSDLQLETWFPEGVLDAHLAAFMVHFIGFEEHVSDEPFNRYADLSKLTAIHLEFLEVAALAAERRASCQDMPPVKSAFLAPDTPAYGIARMFAAFMEPSPIHVRVFRNIEDAAAWLEVPVEALVSS